MALLNQPYIKDSDKNIDQLVKETIAATGKACHWMVMSPRHFLDKSCRSCFVERQCEEGMSKWQRTRARVVDISCVSINWIINWSLSCLVFGLTANNVDSSKHPSLAR